MAVIIFSQPVPFPIAPLRELLAKHLPLYSWMCGENDTGAPKQMAVLNPHEVVTGRSATTVIFTELRAQLGRYRDSAPAHEWYLEVGPPTTELRPVADRITLITCMTMMIPDSAKAFCQLRPGGNWLTAEELLRVFKLVINGEDLAVADGLGLPADACRTAPAAAPSRPAAHGPDEAPVFTLGEDAIERMIAPMHLMLDRTLTPDWRQIEDFARQLDPDGGWKHVEAAGIDALMGRGTRVMVIEKDEPVSPKVYAQDLARSFWYKGDLDVLTRHRRHASIGTALDASAADWETTRQVAKVITLVTGLLARLPATAAVYNLGIGTIFEPKMVSDFLSILGRDQLPVPLWVFTAWHSLEPGNICLSTSGLAPLLGHEIEAWNAPLTPEEAQEKVSDLVIYLLDKGPVIGHGDTCGRTKGEKSIRCFRGPSRAERARPVQALFLEFEGDIAVEPKPDLPAAGLSAEEPLVLDQLLDNPSGRVSPAMAKILGDVRKGTGAAPPPAQPPSQPQQGHPVRRATGFGRKGL